MPVLRLEQAVILGLAAFLAVVIMRSLPLIRTWVRAGIRPFACDKCMSAWFALGFHYPRSPTLAPPWSWWLVTAAAAGICLLVLTWYGPGAPSQPPLTRGNGVS